MICLMKWHFSLLVLFGPILLFWRFPLEIQIFNDVRSMQFSVFSQDIQIINGHRDKTAQFTHSKAFKFRNHTEKTRKGLEFDYLPYLM